MTNYQRLTAKVFGETATATGNEPEIGQFGSALAGTYVGTTDVATIQNLTAWSNGFIDCVTPENQFPPLPEMTGFGKVLSYHEAYLLQKGIPEWDSATTYYQDDFCRVGHTVYYSLQDGNINHNPTTDTLYWKDFTIGANQELSNLEDAGEDRLHALKGYLESGKGYTDTTLYKDVYGYNHSTFDVSKFTVVGSPTITDEGIVSGLSKSDYLTIPVFDLTNFIFSMSFDITSLDTTTVLVEDNTIWRIPTSSQTYRSRLALYATKRLGVGVYLEDNTNNTTALQTEPLTALGRYKTIFTFNGTKYTFIVVYPDGSIVTKELNSTSRLQSDGNPIFIGTNSTNYERSFFAGNIDLKTCKIYKNGIPIFTGTKTGIDTIKPANYTVVGTPTISADGIASGFTTSDYISIDTSNIDLLTANTWEIDFTVKLNNSTATTQMYFDTFESGVSSTLRFDYNNPNNQNAFRMLLVATDNTRIFDYATIKQNIVLNTWYKFKLSYTGTHYIIKDADGNILKDVESNKKVNLTSRILVGKRQANDQSLTNGSIDLNAFKIYVDGNLIYQPCLKIPYTESSTGSKVVDVAYRDRVIDVYEQYGSANYYTIQENAITNYTVTGNPTISANYVASGFTTGTGIKLTCALDTTKDFSLKGLFNFTSAPNDQTIFGVNSNGILYLHMNSNRRLLLSLSTNTSSWNIVDDASSSDDITLSTNVWIELKKTGTTYDVNVSLDGQTWTNYITTTSSSNIGNGTLSNLTLGGHQSALGTVLQGSVDLKTVKISQNGEVAYEAVSEPNATLPMGEVYGFIEQKANTDFSNTTQTGKNTSISWGMPDWSRAINKNPYETYTATERGWVNAQGYTNQDEIGVKINTNVVAYTQAPGGTGDDSGFACLVPVDVGDEYETYVVNGASTNERIDFVKFIPCKGEA